MFPKNLLIFVPFVDFSHLLFFCAQSCLGKNLVIDPILEEESYQDGSLLITCMPSRNEVTQLTVNGEWSTPRVHEVRLSQSSFLIKYVGLLNVLQFWTFASCE